MNEEFINDTLQSLIDNTNIPPRAVRNIFVAGMAVVCHEHSFGASQDDICKVLALAQKLVNPT